MKQEDDANQHNDQALFNERAHERFDRAIDQVGPVIDRFDGHALRQARGNLREAVLYFLDDGERVFSEPLQCDARNDFAFAVHLGNAAALVRGELNSRHVPEQHRDAAVVLDDNLFEIGEALDVAAATYGELGLGQLHGSAADIHVAGTDRVADFSERNAQRLQPPRVDHDAVLFDEPADAGDLGYAFRFGDAIADVPILDRTQLGQVLLRAAHDVLINPANPGRIGSEGRGDPDRQTPSGRTEIFEHTRARPVEIGAVLKDDVDERDAEERESADYT